MRQQRPRWGLSRRMRRASTFRFWSSCTRDRDLESPGRARAAFCLTSTLSKTNTIHRRGGRHNDNQRCRRRRWTLSINIDPWRHAALPAARSSPTTVHQLISDLSILAIVQYECDLTDGCTGRERFEHRRISRWPAYLVAVLPRFGVQGEAVAKITEGILLSQSVPSPTASSAVGVVYFFRSCTPRRRRSTRSAMAPTPRDESCPSSSTRLHPGHRSAEARRRGTLATDGCAGARTSPGPCIHR